MRLHYAHDEPLIKADPDLRWYRWADNLAYIATDMSQAEDTLHIVTELLSAAGFELKGADGPPKDLRIGQTVELLGFNLGYQSGRFTYRPGSHAWSKLAESLDKAHEEENPPRVAQAVLDGWVQSLRPAYEHVVVADELDKVAKLAANYGFRDIVSRKALDVTWRQANFAWQQMRQKVRGQFQTMVV